MRKLVHVAHMGKRRGVYTVLVGGGAEGKGPLERPRSRWEDNINISYILILIWLRKGTGGGLL